MLQNSITVLVNISYFVLYDSDTTDYEFINSMVLGIQRLLDHMAVRGNPANRQGGSMVPARPLEREVNRQGSSMKIISASSVYTMVPARQLVITHSENSQKWAWSFINEAPNYTTLEVATMIKIHWLKIFGKIETRNLTPGTEYEAVFLVKLEDNSIGWEQPVTLKLKVEEHDGNDYRVDRNENLKDYVGHNWVDILAGVFVVPPSNTPAKITFTMFQYVTDDRKRGLVVKDNTRFERRIVIELKDIFKLRRQAVVCISKLNVDNLHIIITPRFQGPQVFINFRGAELRNSFVAFLEPILRDANINAWPYQKKRVARLFLVEQGTTDRNEREFINSIVFEIQRLMSQIAVRRNPKVESNGQGGFLVPAKRLEITHFDNPEKWSWNIEIATMINIHTLIQINGDFHTRKLTPGRKYEVVFLLSLDDSALGWKKDVTLTLKVVMSGTTITRSEDECQKALCLDEYIGEDWVEIPVGNFEAPPTKHNAKIFFSMRQYVDSDPKSGLVVKGVAVRPVE
ncbi:unnamed protein product [Thlaspi arvense]|uniref:Uncharacterized protein n=1 Tax=Thlaspi arvense TaxID=13288 RepID=A0AAU9RRQ7_THLAR|nr:unnamed protein product [Thlaspi arvense]